MLRKVELHIMEPTVNIHQFAQELDTFERRAKESAFSLHTLIHLSIFDANPASNQCALIAERLFAISALVPALRDFIRTPWYSTPDTPYLSDKQVEILSKSVWSCGPVLDGIDKAVEYAREAVPSLTGKSVEIDRERLTAFLGSENELEVLYTCFRSILVVLSAVRVEWLYRKFRGGHMYVSLFFPSPFLGTNVVNRTAYESGERCLLLDALEHPTYNRPLGLATPYRLPILTTEDTRPGKRDLMELQHPKGFRGRYGHPDYPLAQKQAQVSLDPAEPNLAFARSFEEEELERHRLR